MKQARVGIMSYYLFSPLGPEGVAVIWSDYCSTTTMNSPFSHSKLAFIDKEIRSTDAVLGDLDKMVALNDEEDG